MTATPVMQPAFSRAGDTVTRLLVTVRDPGTRLYRPVGFLSQMATGYSFAYLRTAVERSDFRPLPGLARAVMGPVESKHLFALFAERVISSRRPDRQESLAALGLPLDAAPFEVLARSQGQRVGDTIELLPAPFAEPGSSVSFTFLAHGVRHLPTRNQARIETLTPGEPLRLQCDAGNEVNPKAQIVTDLDDLWLGWMPDPLINVVESVEHLSLSVERSNGADVGFHFRLLVRLQGVVRANAELFTGPAWETLA